MIAVILSTLLIGVFVVSVVALAMSRTGADSVSYGLLLLAVLFLGSAFALLVFDIGFLLG